MESTLNLAHNVKELILKALNKTKHEKDAAILLGISKTTLYRYKNQLHIIRLNNIFISNQKETDYFTFFCNRKK